MKKKYRGTDQWSGYPPAIKPPDVACRDCDSRENGAAVVNRHTGLHRHSIFCLRGRIVHRVKP
jgi:hypothetical protein